MSTTFPPLTQYVEVDPDVRGGKPRIAGTRITVADVVIMYLRMDYALEEIAAKFDLPVASVYAAMSYYFDHKEEIDRSIGEDEAFVETFETQNPSLLQQRVKQIRHD